jgi:transcriptional/translational regulatory protein YebC/TACO1
MSGAALESLTIEAMLPPSVATVIECQTDSKARTLQDLRAVIKDYGGAVASTSYFFQKKGKIVFGPSDLVHLDDIFDRALEAGATDLDEDDEGRIVVYTEPTSTVSVANTLAEATGLKLDSSDIIWDPNQETMVKIDNDQAIKKLDDCVAAIQEDSSVQGVYLNAICEN